MRLCTTKAIPAIFHCWEQVSQVIPPSPMVGGHGGGEIKYMTAVVEYRHNGQVTHVSPSDIIFEDTEAVAKELEDAKNDELS